MSKVPGCLQALCDFDIALPFGNILSPEPKHSHLQSPTSVHCYQSIRDSYKIVAKCAIEDWHFVWWVSLLLIITWFLALSIVPLWVVGQYSSKTLDSLIGDKAVAPIFDNASTLQQLFDVFRNLLLRSTINQIKDSDLLVAYSLAYSQIFGGIQEAAFALLIWFLFICMCWTVAIYKLKGASTLVLKSIWRGATLEIPIVFHQDPFILGCTEMVCRTVYCSPRLMEISVSSKASQRQWSHSR